MWRIIGLEILECENIYFLNKYSGDVYLKNYLRDKKTTKEKLPRKVEFALSIVMNPYQVSKVMVDNNPRLTSYNLLYKYALQLTNLTNKSFFIARLSASFRKKRFDNSSQAINFFRSLNLPKPQDELCLSRTLFAASLSQAFEKSGVLFIGIHLPSDNLHSWIIENGIQVDDQDKIWINYQPIAVIY